LVQRTRKSKLTPERQRRLDEIGFVWDILLESWEEGFSYLLRFKEIEGHCRVPKTFKLEGFNLGGWVERQKTSKSKSKLTPERQRRLDEIGFVWEYRIETWEKGLNNLLRFKEIEGHCRVPKTFKLEGFALGSWVHRQRRFVHSLSTERKQRLTDIGFIWDGQNKST